MGSTYKGLSIFSYVLSLVSIIIGLVVAYHYGDYDAEYYDTGSKFNHVVGGDAYNYIIMASRGTMWVVIGLIFAVIASAFLIGFFMNDKQEKNGQITNKGKEVSKATIETVSNGKIESVKQILKNAGISYIKIIPTPLDNYFIVEDEEVRRLYDLSDSEPVKIDPDKWDIEIKQWYNSTLAK